MRGYPRRAASRAPARDPIAMNDPSTPYSPAPLWNSRVAIRALVIWKFIPKVPGGEGDDEDEDQLGTGEYVPHAVSQGPLGPLERDTEGVSSAARIARSEPTTAR